MSLLLRIAYHVTARITRDTEELCSIDEVSSASQFRLVKPDIVCLPANIGLLGI
jgi:hypothetical protein